MIRKTYVGAVALAVVGLTLQGLAQERIQVGVVQGPDGNRMIKVGDGPYQPMMVGGKGVVLDAADIAAMGEQGLRRMNEAFKEQMGSSAEEWAVISPKIEKIQSLQAVVGERTSKPIGTGSQLPANIQGMINDVNGRQSDLAAVSANSPNAAEVKSRIASLRDSRRVAAEELATTRKELTDLVTAHQEAVLLLRGILK